MAREAELTRPSEPVTAEGEPLEAGPIRPGKAARAVVSDGHAVHDAIEAVLAAPGESREVARQAYEAVRDRLIADALAVMPVDRLRDLIQKKITFAPLIDAGMATVGAVLAAGAGRAQAGPRGSPQVGQADHVRRRADEGVRRGMSPAFASTRTPGPPSRPRCRCAAPLRALPVRAQGAGPEPAGQRDREPPGRGRARREPSENALHVLRAEEAPSPRCPRRAGRHPLPPSRSPRPASGWPGREAELEKAGKQQRVTRLWNDYLARPVTYNGLLIDVAELEPEREASQGFLPADIAEQVRVLPA